jgi:hypothetical protein
MALTFQKRLNESSRLESKAIHTVYLRYIKRDNYFVQSAASMSYKSRVKDYSDITIFLLDKNFEGISYKDRNVTEYIRKLMFESMEKAVLKF